MARVTPFFSGNMSDEYELEYINILIYNDLINDFLNGNWKECLEDLVKIMKENYKPPLFSG